MAVTYLDNYRKKKRRKGRKFKIPTSIIYFLLVAVALYFFIHSPFFSIKNIKVEGNELLETEKILSLSQVKRGQNLLKIDIKEIGEKISLHPFIKEVEVKRKIPSTLEIKVVEWKPVGFLVCSDGFIQVSEEGHFLALVNDIGSYSFPVISGINLENLPGPGQIIENTSLIMALKIIKDSDQELLKNIVEINISNKKYILAYTSEGIEIKLGSFENIGERLSELNDIIYDLKAGKIDGENIEYIDLRFNGPPLIKTKK